jgi:hypothetical protein
MQIFTSNVSFHGFVGQQPPPYSEATAGDMSSKQTAYNPNFP